MSAFSHRVFMLAASLALALPSLASARAPAAARSQAQAEAFLDRLYAYYRDEPAHPRDESKVWTPAMRALMARLDRLDDEARLEVSDGDEICQCQDWGDFRLIERRIVLRGPGRAEASLRFRNLGEERALRLALERTRAGWRVADVYSGDRPRGLAAAYREALARARR